MIPDQHWKQILETEQYTAINENALNLARNFLELRRVYFVSRCPNPGCRDYQKLVLHEYRTEQTRDILEQLKRDELRFYHIICDGFWNPNAQEKADLIAVLTAARRGPGVTLTVRLLEDGLVITCLSGLPVGHPPPSKPQRFEMLAMQLENSTLSVDEREAFVKGLRENGTAEVFLPRHASQFFAG